MLNFVENLLENERGPMNDQDLTKTDYDPDRSLVLIEGLSHFLSTQYRFSKPTPQNQCSPMNHNTHTRVVRKILGLIKKTQVFFFFFFYFST
jgi:hypothetical protein